MNNSPDSKIILVGNKLDLEGNREVQYEEGKKLVDDYGFLDFFETSAKTGENIKNLFIKTASVLYAEQTKYKDIESVTSYSTLDSASGEKSSVKKSKCC